MKFDDDSFGSLRALEDAVNPRWIRQMERLQEASNPSWMRKLNDLARGMTPTALAAATSLSEKLGSSSLVLTSDKFVFGSDEYASSLRWMEAFASAQRRFVSGHDLASIAAVQKAIDPFDRGVALKLAPFDRFERAFKSVLGPSMAEGLTRHLRETALPSMALLSMPSRRPFGLLTAFAGATKAASLMWAEPQLDEGSDPESAGPTVELALLVDEPSAKSEEPKIVIEATAVCLLCNEPLTCGQASFEWIGADRGFLRLPTIPVCVPCLRRDSPSYLERIVEILDQGRTASFRWEVIDGEGQGSGQPNTREHLRLVPNDSSESDGENPTTER